MKTYKCWSPDNETEAEARVYDADSWKDAAERYAMWAHREEEFDEIRVHVRCSNGALFELDIEAEMELNFHSGLGRKLEGAKKPANQAAIADVES